MRKPYLWENVRNVFSFPNFDYRKSYEKYKGPLRTDKRPGPLKIYTKEVLIQWGPL